MHVICPHCSKQFFIHKTKFTPGNDFRPRFWDKVNTNPTEKGCWIWGGHVVGGGYGQFAIGQKQYPAHKIAYEIQFGPVPEGHVVRHKCDVKLCCRPDHLEPGTQRDNVHDMISRGRVVNVRGQDCANATMTNEVAAEILHRYATEKTTQAELAEQYGLKPWNVKNLVSRKNWDHLGIPRHYRRRYYADLAAKNT